jgi:hypothetical protein
MEIVRINLTALFYEHAHSFQSMRMRWARHVARIAAMKSRTKFWSDNLKGGGNSGDLDVDGKVIVKMGF